MAVRVNRKGSASAGGGSQHIDNAAIGVGYGKPYMMFTDGRGFGSSHYTLRIDPENFRDLIEAMLWANADEAIKAIANALKDGIPAPGPEPIHRLILERAKPSEVA